MHFHIELLIHKSDKTQGIMIKEYISLVPGERKECLASVLRSSTRSVIQWLSTVDFIN